MKPVVREFLLDLCGFLRLPADSVSITLSVILLLFTPEVSDFLVVALLQEINIF